MRKLLLLLLLILLPTVAFADLEAHFLDVGHGDCTIITCDGEAMIIDGGNAGSSQLVYNYIKNHNISVIKYAVATHPDADHIGGLPAAFHVAKVQTLLSPVDDYDENRFVTLKKTAQEQSVALTVPEAGQLFQLGGAQITILSPVIRFADSNDLSIVLRIDYGKTSFLFTGDASTAVERDLIARKSKLNADVLHVSHHGSSTGTSPTFVSAVSPDYAIISCAEDSASPSREVLFNLAETRTLITAQKGIIVITSDGEILSISCEKIAEKKEDLYVGNSNSRVYHFASCESVTTMKDKNRVYFDSVEQAESKGYHPCKRCSPGK